MFPGIIVGVVGGLAAAKLLSRRFRRGGGACGHGHGMGFGWRRGFGGGRRAFWLMRELGLDRKQKDEIWSLLGKVRESAGDLRFGNMQGLDTLLDAVSGET